MRVDLKPILDSKIAFYKISHEYYNEKVNNPKSMILPCNYESIYDIERHFGEIENQIDDIE
jgi:hypothetical protein